ncbi:MAG: hypothetical protein HQL26_09200 [Candidatus Omnitrophica bacterium]|nr:hypothetical protein [Candidatus Omnitrophota bacterium]
MTKPNPMHLSMVICDSIIEDRLTGKKSLIGIFNNIQANAVPCVHPKLSVFIALTEGNGQYKAQLRCLKVGDEKEIFSVNGEVYFKDPSQIVELIFDFSGLNFPDYGDYRFDFLCEGRQVVGRRFIISDDKGGKRNT